MVAGRNAARVCDRLARSVLPILSELWTVTLATGEKRLLAGATDGVQPSWSPHGQRIAYWTVSGEGQRMGQRDIWTVSFERRDPTSVTSDSALDMSPVWSPDGRSLYFSSDRGGSISLWRIPLDEATGRVQGAPEALTTPSPTAVTRPSRPMGGWWPTRRSERRQAFREIAFDAAAGSVIGTAGDCRRGIPISLPCERFARWSLAGVLLSRPPARYLDQSVRWHGRAPAHERRGVRSKPDVLSRRAVDRVHVESQRQESNLVDQTRRQRDAASDRCRERSRVAQSVVPKRLESDLYRWEWDEHEHVHV